IPSVIQVVADVAADVAVRPVFGRQQITGPGVVTASREGTTDDARELASDQNLHPTALPSPSGASSLALASRCARFVSFTFPSRPLETEPNPRFLIELPPRFSRRARWPFSPDCRFALAMAGAS